jgi:hypothetical protein
MGDRAGPAVIAKEWVTEIGGYRKGQWVTGPGGYRKGQWVIGQASR